MIENNVSRCQIAVIIRIIIGTVFDENKCIYTRYILLYINVLNVLYKHSSALEKNCDKNVKRRVDGDLIGPRDFYPRSCILQIRRFAARKDYQRINDRERCKSRSNTFKVTNDVHIPFLFLLAERTVWS